MSFKITASAIDRSSLPWDFDHAYCSYSHRVKKPLMAHTPHYLIDVFRDKGVHWLLAVWSKYCTLPFPISDPPQKIKLFY